MNTPDREIQLSRRSVVISLMVVALVASNIILLGLVGLRDERISQATSDTARFEDRLAEASSRINELEAALAQCDAAIAVVVHMDKQRQQSPKQTNEDYGTLISALAPCKNLIASAS